MLSGRPDLRVSPAGRRILRVVWSLGWASRRTIEVAVPVSKASATQQLQRLRRADLLAHTQVMGERGTRTTLWRLGRRAVATGSTFTSSWRAPLTQVEHTLFVARVLRRFLASGEATGWCGEAELRTWVPAGEPLPDLRLRLYERWWSVEVDTGTESRQAWVRKLAGYVRHPGPALVVTTTEERAERIARLAAEREVPLLACGSASFFSVRPQVYDARYRKVWALSDALTG